MANDLLSLPQELHIRILSHLDAISLTHCAMTCRSMHRTLQTTSQLLYILQLHFAGLTDAGTGIAHAELIERLRHHRQAWLSPNTTGEREYVAIDMQYQSHAYELVGGIFASTDGEHFEVVSLPTSSNEESRTPRRCEPGMRIRDFTMDPTQDVVAFLEEEDDTNLAPPMPGVPRIVRVHIRTLSTNEIHPRAQQGFLEVSIPSRSDRFINYIHSVTLNFARDMLVLYLCAHDQMRPYIQIWDWTSAEVVLDCLRPFDQAISERVYEFGLLDSTYCFVTDMAAGSIRLYELVRSPAGAVARVPMHLATLHFPTTADERIYVLQVSLDARARTAHPRPAAPFVQNDADRLHVFMLKHAHYPNARPSMVLNLFVHQRVFMGYCARHAGEGGVPREVPWAEWGPVHTRLVCPAKIHRHLLKYVDGQRVVWTRPWTDGVDLHGEVPPNTIEILDFSLAAVSSAKDVSPIPSFLEKGNQRRLEGASTIRAGQLELFKDDVETHLPCVSTVWKLQQEYGLYMIYEDGVIGIDQQSDRRFILHIYPV